MLEPVVKTIEVPCAQKQAFDVFADMPSWWPLDKRSMSLKSTGKPAKSLRIDARKGGQIMEVAHDDSEQRDERDQRNGRGRRTSARAVFR